MKHPFGWSYPPGCSGPPDDDYPCEVCGNHPDDCTCPECPECGEQGNPTCYVQDGHLSHIKLPIMCLRDLLIEVEGDDVKEGGDDARARRIARRLYKGTKCGISFSPTERGIQVSGYCEGWDGECEAYELTFPFTAEAFWNATADADNDGCFAWNQSHGCESCWPEGHGDGEFGCWPINPECLVCHGNGVVL